jgi:hypothetical protein
MSRNDGVNASACDAPTQKPVAHFCGRVSGATIQFVQNTIVHWTSQPASDFVFHKYGEAPRPAGLNVRGGFAQHSPQLAAEMSNNKACREDCAG